MRLLPALLKNGFRSHIIAQRTAAKLQRVVAISGTGSPRSWSAIFHLSRGLPFPSDCLTPGLQDFQLESQSSHKAIFPWMAAKILLLREYKQGNSYSIILLMSPSTWVGYIPWLWQIFPFFFWICYLRPNSKHSTCIQTHTHPFFFGWKYIDSVSQFGENTEFSIPEYSCSSFIFLKISQYNFILSFIIGLAILLGLPPNILDISKAVYVILFYFIF